MRARTQFLAVAVVSLSGASGPRDARAERGVVCPDDAEPVEFDAPEGRAAWCERLGLAGEAKKHGPATTWDTHGTRRAEQHWRQGLRDGPCSRFFANGQQSEQGRYVRGLRHGDWVQWYPSGRMRARWTYRHGEREGPVLRWHSNGAIREQGAYAGDLRHGRFIRWYPNGQKEEEIRYHHGLRDGRWRRWDEAGHLVFSTACHRDVCDRSDVPERRSDRS